MKGGKGGKLVKASESAVAVMEKTDTAVGKGMLEIINQDMRSAQAGALCALRAGFGLLIMKELNLHGEWEKRMEAAFPTRSIRTLQNYMATSRKFCDVYGITPKTAWDTMKDITYEQMDSITIAPPPDVKQLTGGKEKSKAKHDEGRTCDDFSQMLIAFVSHQKSEKKKEAEPPKPLTKKEKIEAAVDNANRVAEMVQDWAGDMTWALVDADTLEGVASVLRTAADKLRAEIRTRQK